MMAEMALMVRAKDVSEAFDTSSDCQHWRWFFLESGINVCCGCQRVRGGLYSDPTTIALRREALGQ